MPSYKTYRRILDERTHTFIAQGSHAAYVQLQDRYKRAAQAFIHELIDIKYKNCGVTPSELITICNDSFPNVVRKFNPQKCSFYTFWRKSIELQIGNYMSTNYYSEKSKTQVSFVSFDNDYNENTIFSSIKLFMANNINDITSPITLKVFTYNDEEDFDETGHYRGISSYSITIYNR